jgi:hypothetical protein
MDSSSLINAVSNPGAFATNPLEEEQAYQDTSLSAQGVTSNPALENFMQMMQGNSMSSSTNFGGTVGEGTVDFGSIPTSAKKGLNSVGILAVSKFSPLKSRFILFSCSNLPLEVYFSL